MHGTNRELSSSVVFAVLGICGVFWNASLQDANYLQEGEVVVVVVVVFY